MRTRELHSLQHAKQKAADSNKDEKLSAAELFVFLDPRFSRDKAELAALKTADHFTALDTDHNGLVSWEEWKLWLEKSNPGGTVSPVKKVGRRYRPQRLSEWLFECLLPCGPCCQQPKFQPLVLTPPTALYTAPCSASGKAREAWLAEHKVTFFHAAKGGSAAKGPKSQQAPQLRSVMGKTGGLDNAAVGRLMEMEDGHAALDFKPIAAALIEAADDNGDGKLSLKEIVTHAKALGGTSGELEALEDGAGSALVEPANR